MYSNRYSNDYFIEKYKSIKINITSAINDAGILYVNEKNDSLYGVLHTGISDITRIIGYSSNYTDSLLIYNDSSWGLYKDYVVSEDKLLPTIIPNLPTKYKINAKKSHASNYTESTFFALTLTGKSVFKVILNNKETNSYSASSLGITITDSNLLDPYFNTITVIYYNTIQTITTSFYLEYQGVEKIYNIESSTCDFDFFDNMISIKNIGDFSDTISKTLTEVSNNNFNFNKTKLMTDSKNTLSMVFNEGYSEIYNIEGKFRFLTYDMMIDKLTMYVGASVSNGINKAFSNSVNQHTVQIDFEDRIEVYGTGALVSYGEGAYGVGLYGMKVISSIYGEEL